MAGCCCADQSATHLVNVLEDVLEAGVLIQDVVPLCGG